MEKLSLTIAKRFLRSSSQFRFLALLSRFAFFGLAIGIATLIIVSSIFNGFRSLIQKELLFLDPHLQITLPDTASQSVDSLLLRIRTIPNVLSATSVLTGTALATSGRNLRIVRVIAIQPDSAVTALLDSTLIAGSDSLTTYPQNVGLVGVTFANQFALLPQDTLFLAVPQSFEQLVIAPSAVVHLPFRISGIFRSQEKRYDGFTIFTHFSSGEKLLSPQNRQFHIWVRGKSIEDIPEIYRHISLLLPTGTVVKTWKELNPALYTVMRLERTIAYAVLSLIVLVALFCILAMLIMAIQIKKPEIGILKAMGAQSKAIQNIFLWMGLLISLRSVALGSFIGIGTVLSQKYYGWFRLDPTRYIVPTLPVELSATDVLLTVTIAIVLTAAISYFPARRAARLRSVYSLLYEERIL